MAFQIDKNGNITLVQGDSGKITVSGIKTDKNYTVYFGIKDKQRNTVGSELSVSSNGMSSVIFELTGDFTDLLKVPKNKLLETYYYGIKVCDSVSGYEDTLVFGGCGFLNLNTITVFPKKVEGI